MSKMGNVILDIQNLYDAGRSPEEIVKETNSDKTFVNGVIDEYVMQEFFVEPDPEVNE